MSPEGRVWGAAPLAARGPLDTLLAYGKAREALDQAETDCRIGRFERCGDDLKVASKYDPDAARSDEAKQLSQQVQEGNDLREMNAKPGMLPRRR